MAYLANTLFGIVSVTIFPKITFVIPPARPINSLPVVRDAVSPIIEIREPKMAKEFPIIAVRRLPVFSRKPDIKLPITRPTIAAELMIVLYRIVSSLSQSNFAWKIEVVAALPTNAKALCHVPTPQQSVNATQYAWLISRWSSG